VYTGCDPAPSLHPFVSGACLLRSPTAREVRKGFLGGDMCVSRKNLK
jgi:hypothetical protein